MRIQHGTLHAKTPLATFADYELVLRPPERFSPPPLRLALPLIQRPNLCFEEGIPMCLRLGYSMRRKSKTSGSLV